MIDKLLSGKFLLTIACGVVFVFCAVTGVLKEATIAAVIVGVFKDYFNKDGKKGGV